MNFPDVSFVTGRRIFRPYLFLLAGIFLPYLYWDFPALTFQAWECKKSPLQGPECRDFPSFSVVFGRDLSAVAFLAWGI
jgi:hypothetical protein